MATVPAPDPVETRAANLAELARLGLPLPPPTYPLVWEPGDQVSLRPTRELEARAAILYVTLERCFGMPPELAVDWLTSNALVDDVTDPEWAFITKSEGDHRSFALHLDAVAALTWVLGTGKRLDPTGPPDPQAALLPNLATDETFDEWRARTLPAPRDPALVAAVLDLYYCLDWAFIEAETNGLDTPGHLGSSAIGQRRWGLEWAVVLEGPYQEPELGWEEIDLST